MTELEFHKAKEIFIQEISKYFKAADSQNHSLTQPKFERNGKQTKIELTLPSNIDTLTLTTILLKGIETDHKNSLTIQTSWREPYIQLNDLLTIWFEDIENYGNNQTNCLGKRKIRFNKTGDLTSSELEALIQVYKKGNLIDLKPSPEQELYNLGIKIYTPEEVLTWEHLAGYEEVKKQVRVNIVNALKNPEMYDRIAKETRAHFKSNRPKAILFEGPPGTGKTLTGRIIASQVQVPMIYLPVEAIMSKWYGESENRLGKAFDAANEMGDSVLFIDEIDSLATSRDREMNEATRRVLGVLLRKLDGLDQKNKTIALFATNKKDDLDSALKRRIASSIYFELPNTPEREAIFGLYAKHLTPDRLTSLADMSNGLSGSNIEEICGETERSWATTLIEDGKDFSLPPFTQYIKSLQLRESAGI